MKILVFSHDGKLGDAVVNTAFVRGARLLDPGVELHVLASGSSAAFWQNDGRIAKIWNFENPPLWQCLTRSWAIRRERFDYVVAFKERFRSEKTRILLHLAAPKIATLYEEGRQAGQVTHAVLKSELSLQAIYGERATELPPRYELPLPKSSALPKAMDGLATDQALVVVNLFGSEPSGARTIKTEAAATLLHQLAVDWPQAAIALSCTDATEAEAAAAVEAARQQLAAAGPPMVLANTEQDLDALIALCQRAQLIITPDTSLVHIASALNKPVVAIYQNDGVKAIEWAPLCDHSAIVISPDPRTIHGFSVPEVVQKARALRQNAPH